jgi:hypothetical protein
MKNYRFELFSYFLCLACWLTGCDTPCPDIPNTAFTAKQQAWQIYRQGDVFNYQNDKGDIRRYKVEEVKDTFISYVRRSSGAIPGFFLHNDCPVGSIYQHAEVLLTRLGTNTDSIRMQIGYIEYEGFKVIFSLNHSFYKTIPADLVTDLSGDQIICAFNYGSCDTIQLINKLVISSQDYEKVFKFQWNRSQFADTTAKPPLKTVFYRPQNGIIRFETDTGENWEIIQ